MVSSCFHKNPNICDDPHFYENMRIEDRVRDMKDTLGTECEWLTHFLVPTSRHFHDNERNECFFTYCTPSRLILCLILALILRNRFRNIKSGPKTMELVELRHEPK